MQSKVFAAFTFLFLATSRTMAAECSKAPGVNTYISLVRRPVQSTECSGLPGQFDDQDTGAAKYLNFVKSQKGTTCSKGTCNAKCSISLMDQQGVEDALSAQKSKCMALGGKYDSRPIPTLPTTNVKGTADDSYEQSNMDRSSSRSSSATCTTRPWLYSRITYYDNELGTTNCSNLPGSFDVPSSGAAQYAQFVKDQYSAKCREPSECVDLCAIALESESGITDLLGAQKKQCLDQGGTYSQKPIPAAGTTNIERTTSTPIDVSTLIQVGELDAEKTQCFDLEGPQSKSSSAAAQYVQSIQELGGSCNRDGLFASTCTLVVTEAHFVFAVASMARFCGANGGTFSKAPVPTAENVELEDTDMAAGSTAPCDHRPSVDAILGLPGELGPGFASCRNLPGEFSLASSGAGEYVAYLTKLGGKCRERNSCLAGCVFYFASDASLIVALNGMKENCSSDGGQFQGPASTITEEMDIADTDLTTRSNLDAQGCNGGAGLFAGIQVNGANVGGAGCSHIPGRFNEASTGAGKYYKYVSEQSEKCAPLSDTCSQACRINLVDKPVSALGDLLGGLEQQCQDDGGTYTKPVKKPNLGSK